MKVRLVLTPALHWSQRQLVLSVPPSQSTVLVPHLQIYAVQFAFAGQLS
jgi:hypothetical protein